MARMFVARRLISTSSICSAGHNKWSKIKHKKGANDANKSAVYTKAQRDILVAVRTGGSTDPSKNAALATVLSRVKAAGVPKDNIAKALAKASEGKSGGETLNYEAIAFNSVGLIIECASDNPTRTIQTLREILSDHNARMASVSFMFKQQGFIKASVKSESDLDVLTEVAIDIDPDADFSVPPDDKNIIEKFTCKPSLFASLKTALLETGSCQILASQLDYNPLEDVEPSEELYNNITALVDSLEANQDTLRVWTSIGTGF